MCRVSSVTEDRENTNQFFGLGVGNSPRLRKVGQNAGVA